MHAIAIFLGAYLVFAVQPLLGKVLLPSFGGSATVWTACLMFFQVGLLAGYAYAYGICRWLPPRWQALLHVAMLAASLALLPAVPSAEAWKPQVTVWPTGWIVLLLAVNIGLPFVLLSATTPLVARWFSGTRPRGSPYRLYALSNAGSLLALLAYPFLIEPLWNVRAQGLAWSWGYGLFALCAACCASAGAASRAAPPILVTTAGRRARSRQSPLETLRCRASGSARRICPGETCPAAARFFFGLRWLAAAR